jgi:hypothetical protein
MLKAPSPRVQECYRRADNCARRAELAGDAELREFWEQQEARWIQIASYSEFSEQVASFLQSGCPTPAAILRDEESDIDALVGVFSRLCIAMKVDAQDNSKSSIIALTVVKAAQSGKHDAETLYDLALQMLSR